MSNQQSAIVNLKSQVAILMGAGRGQRLMPFTEEGPKSLAPLGGRRILDWGLEALAAAGVSEVVFVGGYRIDRVREAYPTFTYRENAAWERTNMLVSLFYAEDRMADGFLCAYADILYRPAIGRALAASRAEITLAVDTAWRARYRQRTDHPEADGEKVYAEGDRVTAIGRHLDAARAHGEYIGVARFTAAGARVLREHYHRAAALYDGRPFQHARSFQQAYLIDLYQEMLDRGVEIHKVDAAGGYLEIDTTEDYAIAQREWTG